MGERSGLTWREEQTDMPTVKIQEEGGRPEAGGKCSRFLLDLFVWKPRHREVQWWWKLR